MRKNAIEGTRNCIYMACGRCFERRIKSAFSGRSIFRLGIIPRSYRRICDYVDSISRNPAYNLKRPVQFSLYPMHISFNFYPTCSFFFIFLSPFQETLSGLSGFLSFARHSFFFFKFLHTSIIYLLVSRGVPK